MNNSQVCIDASFLTKLVILETHSQEAKSLWEEWIWKDVEAVAPLLLPFELTAILRKKLFRKLLTDAEADTAFAKVLALEVELLDPDDLHVRAWAMARRLNQPTAYDSHYLALAESLNCEFWTADERLFNAVHDKLDWVHWIGNYRA